MTRLSNRIQNILLPRFDTLGDIVLLTGFIDSLHRAYPEALITMLVQDGYDQLCTLMPSYISWVTLSLDGRQPFTNYSPAQIESELTRINSVKYDLVCFTTYNRTWPEVLIAASLLNSYRFALGNTLSIDEKLILESFTGKTFTSDDLFEQLVEVQEWSHETEKYNIFWTKCFSSSTAISLPFLNVPETASKEISALLADLVILGGYFVCMPAGLQHVPIKTWPIERFIEIICWIQKEYGWIPLVVGHESEEEVINQVVSSVTGRGVKIESWLGKNGQLSVLAYLIKNAQLYIGNDSAPLHIACAVKTPVVGLYGGGTFPRFMPFGNRAIGIAGELPCFGCFWYCKFGDAPCMRMVTVNDAKNAVKMVLSTNPPSTNYLPVKVANMASHRELLLFEWVVVDNCNLNCSYCVNKGEYSQKPKSKMLYSPGLELDIARKIVELSSNADHVVVNLTGGDPLLSKYFVDLLSILASVGNIQIRLITNMKLLKNVAEKICEIYPNLIIGGSIHAQYRSDEEIDQLADFLNEYKGRLNISLSQVDSDLIQEDRAKVSRLSDKTEMQVDFQRFIPPWTEAGKIADAQRISDENFAPSLGKRCCLGFSRFLLLPDGTFCHDLWCMDREAKVGNFLDLSAANLNNYILEDMKKCPKSSCGCNYNLFNYAEYFAACQRLGYAAAEIFGSERLQKATQSDEAVMAPKNWLSSLKAKLVKLLEKSD